MTPGRELPPFLVDSGEMGELIAARDWSATPLGPMAGWDAGLKAMVSMMLAAERPVALLCGEMGTLVYNKGYAEICGTRHPAVLGKGVLEAWPEAADFNGNVLATCLAGGKLTYKDTHLVLQRNGTPEDTWFDLDYSPFRDAEGRVIGVLALVSETTAHHHAGEALRTAEERFRQSLNAAGVIGIWDWHFDSDLMFADAPFATFFQVDSDRAERGVPRREFGLRIHLIVRETEDEAWATADRLISRVTDDLIAEAQNGFVNISESVGQKRMSALHQGRRDRLLIGPNLWAGPGLVRGGAGTALVGNPHNVAARIREYQEIGIETIIASGYPHLEEAFNVAELLFPELGLSGEAAPAERSWDVEFGRGTRPKVAASAS